ncbi:MAG: DUF1294 domain-containing protein [Pseudomonadota bacterium]|nr:DUF1294 domain-containing protein [Pseudomonadota bacterium]
MTLIQHIKWQIMLGMIDMKTLLVAAVGVNIAAFLLYWHDKQCAKHHRPRVPEAILLGSALIGGSPGAFLGMTRFRHKTRKTGFRLRYWLIVCLQLGALLYWLVYGGSG